MPDSMDALTGLPTFRALADEIAARTGGPISAVFLDIDGFRIVNCDYGHLVGDDILARLGTWLVAQAETLRGRAYRVAGDKFALLLPERNLVEAAQIANAIVANCPSLPLPLPITFSAAVIALSRDRVPSRELIDELGNELCGAELASGRNHSNVVVIETPAA